MSATLKELRDQVVIDAGVEGQSKFPKVRVNRIVNQASKFVQLKLTGLGMKKWEAKSDAIVPDANTFVGTDVKTISIADDLENLLEGSHSIPFIEVNDGTNHGISYPVDKERFYSQITNTFMIPSITDNESVFMRLSGLLYLFPESITEAFIHHYKVITTLENDDDKTEIPTEYEEFIIKRSVLEIDDINGKITDKQDALRQMEQDIRGVFQSFEMANIEDDRIAKKNNARLQ